MDPGQESKKLVHDIIGENDYKLFQKIRKLVLLLFIISEIGAQFLLGVQLYKKRDVLMKYCNNIMVKLKYYFVLTLSVSTLIIIIFLIIFNTTTKLNNILEWNYFIILLLLIPKTYH